MEIGSRVSPLPNSNRSFEKITNYYNSGAKEPQYWQTERQPVSSDWDAVVQSQVHDAQMKKMKEETNK